MIKHFLAILSIIVLFSCNKHKNEQTTQNTYNQLSDLDKRNSAHAVEGIDVLDSELELTLFATEPMMTNPTNMDIDAKGRVWICEAYNYRNVMNPDNPYKKTGDRILIMEDTNGDGKADKSKVFYQGEDINAALGIAVLGNKVVVSCSPKVYIFTDENGDDIADKKEVMFEGIGGFQHDHGMHAFTFGPDGKLYFNYGNEGKGMLSSKGKPFYDDLGRIIKSGDKPYRDGMVYRCDADGSNVEIMAWNFRNNYELAVDSYGRMWQSDNDDDGNRGTRINYIMDYGNYGFKDEMTGESWQARRTNMEDSIPLRHWHLNDPGVVPNLLQTYAGSPSGITIYEGNLLPKKYQNMMIHCEPGHNVVRAYPVKKKGAGFEAEILNIVDGSAKDNWFRPADVAVAPDGSIFIADWYDAGVGGHSMVDSLRGRIYRLAPKGVKYNIPKNKFDSPESCAEALKSPNLATRYLAWTKLHEMQKGAESALLKLYNSQDSRLRARALWLLGKIKGEEAKYISLALQDKDEDIRITAIRLANESNLDIIPFLKQYANDASDQMRREILIALRHKKSPEAAKIWTSLASKYKSGDRWYLEALGIAADNQWDSFMAEWFNANPNWLQSPAGRDIVWRSRANDNIPNLAAMILTSKGNEKLRYYRAFDFIQSATKNEVLLDIIAKDTSVASQLVAFKHINKSQKLDIVKYNKYLNEVLLKVKNPFDYLDIVLNNQLKNQLDKVLEMALTSKEPKIAVYAASTLVKLEGTKRVKSLIDNKDIAKSIKVVQNFGLVDSKPVTDLLIETFSNKKIDLKIREEAMNAMNGWESEESLWKLMQNNKVPNDVMPIAIKMMLGTWHSDIRGLATKKYAKSKEESTLNIAELVKKNGDKKAGEVVFNTYCSTCHLDGKSGQNFGPSLSQIGDKLSKEGLYDAILNPTKGISFGFETYEITFKDGNIITGIITSKSESTILVKMPGASEATSYNRSNVKTMKEMKDSLMPQFPLKEKEIVDLVEYLGGLRKK